MALKYLLVLVAVSYVSAITFPEESTNRLTNSPTATIDQFPFAISLQRLADLPNHVQAHQCGGALITLQHALTTALCVHTNVNNVPQLLPANAYRVYAGAALLSNDAADRSRSVANFTVHPNYIPYPSSVNDIAIITTTLPFPNTTMTPIPIPAVNFVPADNVLCNVAGWGAPTTTVQASNELRYSTKYIYNNGLCANVWNLNPATTNILPTMICAASYNVISSGCTGDAGNPLVCNGQLTGLLFLTNQCAVSSYPEVYTSVSNYTTWIRSITGAGSTFKPEFSFLAVVAIICMKVFS